VTVGADLLRDRKEQKKHLFAFVRRRAVTRNSAAVGNRAP
jgi:hypothetical protein